MGQPPGSDDDRLEREINMEKMYIGKFEWKTGSINDNIRKILKSLSIGY